MYVRSFDISKGTSSGGEEEGEENWQLVSSFSPAYFFDMTWVICTLYVCVLYCNVFCLCRARVTLSPKKEKKIEEE